MHRTPRLWSAGVVRFLYVCFFQQLIPTHTELRTEIYANDLVFSSLTAHTTSEFLSRAISNDLVFSSYRVECHR